MEQKNSDLARFSHDLRNELGTIYNYAQLLELSLMKKGMEKEADSAREIAESVKRITALLAKHIDAFNS